MIDERLTGIFGWSSISFILNTGYGKVLKPINDYNIDG